MAYCLSGSEATWRAKNTLFEFRHAGEQLRSAFRRSRMNWPLPRLTSSSLPALHPRSRRSAPRPPSRSSRFRLIPSARIWSSASLGQAPMSPDYSSLGQDGRREVDSRQGVGSGEERRPPRSRRIPRRFVSRRDSKHSRLRQVLRSTERCLVAPYPGSLVEGSVGRPRLSRQHPSSASMVSRALRGRERRARAALHRRSR